MTGFLIELVLAGYGVASIIATSTYAGIILKIIGSLWMFYLAFVLRNMHADIESQQRAKIGFGQMLIQQFVNPKAWIMAISGASAFLPHYSSIHLNVFLYAVTFGLVGIPSMFIWLKMGDIIAKIMKSKEANRILGYSMFMLMIISIATIWIK